MRSVSAAVAALTLASVVAKPGDDMPRVNIDMASITTSGISSGAFMASQMHISYSRTINGAGILAGGPYWCAQDSIAIALTACMTTPELLSPLYLETIVRSTAATGFADPVENLANSRVWLMSARNDTVVAEGVVKAAESLYKSFLTDPRTQIATVYDQEGEHSQVTLDYGNPCTTLGRPFINDCGFDAAGAALQHLIRTPLTPPAPGAKPQGNVTAFSQAAFLPGLGDVFGMEDKGYVYVPPQCQDQKSVCPLHIAFHGCEMTLDDIGVQFVYHSGHIPWADANGIVLLFPQAKANAFNPKGCWDWWSYTGTAYSSNIGAQTLTVKRFIDVLTDQPLTPNSTLPEAEIQRRLDGVFRAAPGAVEAARERLA